MPDLPRATFEDGPEPIWFGTANDVHVHWPCSPDDKDLDLFVNGIIDGPVRTTQLVDADGKVWAEEVVNYA